MSQVVVAVGPETEVVTAQHTMGDREVPQAAAIQLPMTSTWGTLCRQAWHPRVWGMHHPCFAKEPHLLVSWAPDHLQVS